MKPEVPAAEEVACDLEIHVLLLNVLLFCR